MVGKIREFNAIQYFPLERKHVRTTTTWHVSSPLDSIEGQTTFDVPCHQMMSAVAKPSRAWASHTIRLRRLWNDIMALGQHTRSDDIVRGMLSSHLGSTHGRITSGIRCHHFPGATQAIGIRRALHAIIHRGCRIQTNLIYLLDFPIVLY